MCSSIRAIVLTVLVAAFGVTSGVAHSASKTVLVLGDSLSAEYGLKRGDGWVALLEKRLQEKHINVPIVNASISGETTIGGKTRLPALLQKIHPSILVIELGANDGLRGLPILATQKNLQEMISSAKKSGARILLIGMQLPPKYGTDSTRRFAALYPTLAKANQTALVPFMFEHIVTRPELFQADRIHPTAAAHPIILESIWPQLQPLLQRNQ